MFIGDVIKSLEARFEKFVGKKLDQKEQSSRTVIKKATKPLKHASRLLCLESSMCLKDWRVDNVKL